MISYHEPRCWSSATVSRDDGSVCDRPRHAERSVKKVVGRVRKSNGEAGREFFSETNSVSLCGSRPGQGDEQTDQPGPDPTRPFDREQGGGGGQIGKFWVRPSGILGKTARRVAHVPCTTAPDLPHSSVSLVFTQRPEIVSRSVTARGGSDMPPSPWWRAGPDMEKANSGQRTEGHEFPPVRSRRRRQNQK